MPTVAGWKSRITREADVDPATLTAHPSNWRTHPQSQLDALDEALDTIGWIQRVIVSERSGRVIDGHARIAQAVKRREPTIPVVYVDLNDDEERLALATLDPLSAMAGGDDERLRALLAEIEAPAGPLADLLDSIAPLVVLGIGEGVVGVSERAGSSPWGRVDASETVRCLIGDVEFGAPAGVINEWIAGLDPSMTTREAAAAWFLRVSRS